MRSGADSCEQVDPFLLDYAYGELAVVEARRVEEHLSACAHCRTALQQMADVRRTMSALTAEPAPQAGLESLLDYARQAAARQKSVRPAWQRVLVPALPLGGLAVVLVVVAVTSPSTKTPAALFPSSPPSVTAAPPAQPSVTPAGPEALNLAPPPAPVVPQPEALKEKAERLAGESPERALVVAQAGSKEMQAKKPDPPAGKPSEVTRRVESRGTTMPPPTGYAHADRPKAANKVAPEKRPVAAPAPDSAGTGLAEMSFRAKDQVSAAEPMADKAMGKVGAAPQRADGLLKGENDRRAREEGRVSEEGFKKAERESGELDDASAAMAQAPRDLESSKTRQRVAKSTARPAAKQEPQPPAWEARNAGFDQLAKGDTVGAGAGMSGGSTIGGRGWSMAPAQTVSPAPPSAPPPGIRTADIITNVQPLPSAAAKEEQAVATVGRDEKRVEPKVEKGANEKKKEGKRSESGPDELLRLASEHERAGDLPAVADMYQSFLQRYRSDPRAPAIALARVEVLEKLGRVVDAQLARLELERSWPASREAAVVRAREVPGASGPRAAPAEPAKARSAPASIELNSEQLAH